MCGVVMVGAMKNPQRTVSDQGSEHGRQLTFLLRGFQISRLLRVVADLGLADRVGSDESRPVIEVAAECGVDAQQLTRVIRCLASQDVFRLSENAEVSHSPMSLLLRTDDDDTLHHAARFWTDRSSWRAWEEMDTVLHGGVPHEQAWGAARFELLRRDPDAAERFDQAMAHSSDGRHQAIADSYDFSGVDTVVDVGGGNGGALRQILGRFGHLGGVLYDHDDLTAADADLDLLDGRIRAESGDFFERVPADGDLYLLVCVLHDWSDDDCDRILQSCRTASRPGTKLLVCDRVLESDPSHGDPMDYLVDVQMMAMYGTGRERTEGEFRRVLERNGYELERILATPSTVSIVEAIAT